MKTVLFLMAFFAIITPMEAKKPMVYMACETYSLRDYMNDGRYDPISVMKLMKELGIKGVMLNDLWMKSYDKPYLDKIKKSAKENGIIIAGLVCEGSLCSDDEVARKKQIEEDAMKMRAAAYLGASVVRLNLGGTGNPEKDGTVGVERCIAAFNELLPLAKKLNLKITIENHGGPSLKSDYILRIIKGTDPKWVGSCLDFKNWPVDVLYEENAKLAPYAYHVHAKAHTFNPDGEESSVEYGRLLKMMKDANYKGAVSIEFEGPGDQIEGVKKTRDLILKYWKLNGAQGMIVVKSPEFSKLVPADAVIEKVAGGFQFTEGPVWQKGGALLFTDIPADIIFKWKPNSKADIFRKPSGNANGLTLDREGRLIACEHGNRRVSREEKDGKITVLASHYEGKRLNSPNDVVLKSDGSIYFTDPPYGVQPKDRELDFQGVYRISQSGTLTLLTDDFDRPNGLALSPDEKILYIADSSARSHIRAFDVKSDGTLANGRVFAELKTGEPGGPDGLKVDIKGNVWSTGPAGVWVFDKTGKHLGTIKPPELPANCAFGDKDGRTLYMTARTGLYRIRTKVKGLNF